jgi:molybdopterin guanine dinucleotide-containing S/N-oxide reductase-like protein
MAEMKDSRGAVSRRSMLKWAGAIAGVAALGTVAAYAGQSLLKPVTTSTTSAATQTSVATSTTPVQEQLLTCCHDTGPFIAHLVNGVWRKSTPLKSNLPVFHNAYSVRDRVNSTGRIRYPMKRVDFDAKGERNTQNRGKSGFVRITWEEALDTVASELKRIKDAYGPSAILLSPVTHQWSGAIHSTGGFLGPPFDAPDSGMASRFFSLLGGATTIAGDTSWTGWTGGGPMVYGFNVTATNNAPDLLQNSKLIIHWATNTAVTIPDIEMQTAGYRRNLWLRRFKDAGIKQIVIDPYFNETAALYSDEWLPILPETDEAMMAAVAYVWIKEGLYDKDFVASHTVGFDKFSDYVLGVPDGTPKTPEWAAQICDPQGLVTADKIEQLAHEWASNPTFIICQMGGANRRNYAASFARMIVTMQAMLGNLGRPGRGLGYLAIPNTGKDMTATPWNGIMPSLDNPVKQCIRHTQFPDAILNPPITWTSVSLDGEISKLTYPAEGCSEVKLIAFMSGSGYFLNQSPGVNNHIRALQSPKIEFVYCHAPWWEASAKFSDIILPVKHAGERDNILTWENYAVYAHTVATPTGEPKNDFEVFVELAKRLGFDNELTANKTIDDWLQEAYTQLGIPVSFDEFKKTGYYEYPLVDETPAIDPHFQMFYGDPANNKLPTPTGKIEIYSQKMSDFFGANDPAAPTIPKYTESPESLNNSLAKKYPLILTTPHPKFGRNSQWQNLSWQRDEYQTDINGYAPMIINPSDANQRGLRTGDKVRIRNDRGSILCTAYVSERIRPNVVRVWEGAWYAPLNPGATDSSGVGGNPDIIISGRQPDALCNGITNCALVEVEKVA